MNELVDVPALLRLLQEWVPRQRWFPAKGTPARLVHRGAAALSGTPDAVVLVHLLAIEGIRREGQREQLVQVPLVHRRAPAGRAVTEDPPGTVGELPGPDGTPWLVIDGPRDPAYVAALLALLGGGTSRGRRAATSARGHLAAGATAPDPRAPSRVLSGEQSNTSIIVTPADGPPVIVKVFRALEPGDNPDVVVAAALARAGCSRIPAPVGWVDGTWSPAPGGGGEADSMPVRGHLAVAAEFLPGSQDAWREALDAVREGRSFAQEARALGAATGEVHLALTGALPTRAATPQDGARLTASLRERAAWALDAAPVLAGLAGPLWALLDEAPALLTGAPVLQQVHGDLHLGQVLHAPGRGWVLLDFEGEPLRPLAERTRPDLALRDVAGMLRSFDYAASTAARDGADAAATRAWDEAARAAFCEGYAAATGRDPRAQRALLDALELDKALYEVVYEARNRPSWLEVPLSAVRRLLPIG